jgi:hypothetical protein
MANPSVVAPGQPVQYTWGLDVRSTVVLNYASVAAFLAEFPSPHEGKVVTIGSGAEPFIWRGGMLRAILTYDAGAFTISGGNLIAGESQLAMPDTGGYLTLYSSAVPRSYIIDWFWQLTGHVGSAEFQASWKVSGGGYYSIAASTAYIAGQTTTGVARMRVSINANTPLYLVPWARIAALSGPPNVNLGGYCNVLALPY